MRGLSLDENIARWKFSEEKWSIDEIFEVINLLLKSGLIREKNGLKRITKNNENKVKVGINKKTMLVHWCLSNIINDRLLQYDAEKKIKLKASDKELIRQINLNYKLFYDIFEESK
mgnify:CR=1 FL=1|tara:strand:+ start:259 stop:606 length:348 start_codon:yes stop_codon:yes gene_type:complete